MTVTDQAGAAMPAYAAVWVRAHAWTDGLRRMDADYGDRGCFLFQASPCETGICGACARGRCDLCLTGQHEGRPLHWDTAVELDGRVVAHLYAVEGQRCAGWVCPCHCRRPEPEPEPEPAAGALTPDDERLVVATCRDYVRDDRRHAGTWGHAGITLDDRHWLDVMASGRHIDITVADYIGPDRHHLTKVARRSGRITLTHARRLLRDLEATTQPAAPASPADGPAQGALFDLEAP